MDACVIKNEENKEGDRPDGQKDGGGENRGKTNPM